MVLPAQEFDRIAQDISSRLRADGISAKPFGAKRLLPDLPLSAQQRIVGRVRTQLELMERMRPNCEEHEKLSVICQYYGLRPVDDDVYNRITDEIAWEVIDFELNQLYRNVRVFECISYSIEECEAFTPWELYSRPRQVLETLAEVTRELAHTRGIIDLEWISPYVMVEAYSPDKGQLEIRHLFACPLMDRTTKENLAFVSAFSSRRLPDDQKVVLLDEA